MYCTGDPLLPGKQERRVICAALNGRGWLKMAGRFCIRFALFIGVLTTGLSTGVHAGEPITEQDAHAIAVRPIYTCIRS